MPSPVADPLFVFSPAAAGAGTGSDPPSRSTGPSDNQTRREISQILRQLAAAVGSDQPPENYSRALVEQVYHAAAADGVTLWRYRQLGEAATTVVAVDSSLRVVRRCGNVNDRTFDRRDAAANRRLVAEVVHQQTPVVVPPSPSGDPDRRDDNDDVDTGGRNPARGPAAIVPLPMAHPIDDGYALQIFLDDQTPSAAYKPHLRFFAQVADLAGQYFVIEHLQRLTRTADYVTAIAAITDAIPATARSTVIAEHFVDALADAFELRRVCWLDITADPPVVTAVSHCDKIDPAAPATRRISQTVAESPKRPIAALITDPPENDASIATPGQTFDQTSNQTPSQTGWIILRGGDNRFALTIETDLHDAPEIEVDDDGGRSAGCIDPSLLIDPAFLPPLRAGLSQTASMISIARRIEQIPMARFFADNPPDRSTGWFAVAAAAGLIAAMMVWFPMPANVLATATLMPRDRQTIVCTRDAIVRQINVRHGQSVARGDIVAVLSDPPLDQRRLDLIGRRSTLRGQRSAVVHRLIDPATPRDQYRQLEDQQRVLDIQIDGLDRSIEVIDEVIGSLTIAADRDGIVDAWQSDQWVGRPVSRGQTLLHIIDNASPWLAIAAVPDRRIGSVHAAQRDRSLRCDLVVDGSLAARRTATLVGYGPPHHWHLVPQPNRSTPPGGALPTSAAAAAAMPGATLGPTAGSSMSVMFTVPAGDVPDDPAWRTGAPGRVMIYCGEVSLGRWIGGDAASWASEQLAAWMGVWGLAS